METEDSEKYTGLREDIECLLRQFLHTQNVRFQMFAEEWRKLNFTFVHYGIERAQEKKEAMQEAFKIAREYLLPPYDLQHRVGALYIIFALYLTQPYTPKFKIRISVDQWQKVTTLMDTLQSQGHLDALYVFHKLTMIKAFVFTVTPKKMIFHSTYTENKSDQNSTERWLERHRQSLMTECFDDNTLETHHGLHEQYQMMKVKLSLHDNTSLMVVRESITENIVKRFGKLEADFEASRAVHATTGSDETEDRASKISQIKTRSFSTVTTPSRSRRHRQQREQFPTSSDSSAPESPIPKVKKQRGRAKSKASGADKGMVTQMDKKRRISLAYMKASQKKRSAIVKKIKTVRADIFMEEDTTQPLHKQFLSRRKTARDNCSKQSRPTKSRSESPCSSGVQEQEVTKPARKRKTLTKKSRNKASPVSVAPKRKTAASRSASTEQGSPGKSSTKASPPLEACEKHPQKAPRKSKRPRADTSVGQKRDSSEDTTPRKTLKGSGTTKAAKSTKKVLPKQT